MQEEKKVWYKSWVIWFNLAILVVGFITDLSVIVNIPAEILAAVGVAGNILLRFKTALPLQ